MPNQPEVDRLCAYLQDNDVAQSGLTFHVEPSERVLPTLTLDTLQLVLIDGSHSFPQVFIDWSTRRRRWRSAGT